MLLPNFIRYQGSVYRKALFNVRPEKELGAEYTIPITRRDLDPEVLSWAAPWSELLQRLRKENRTATSPEELEVILEALYSELADTRQEFEYAQDDVAHEDTLSDEDLDDAEADLAEIPQEIAALEKAIHKLEGLRSRNRHA